jgi:hypothetical protein
MVQPKDAYYFPHFCNARHDRKVTRLRKELGVEGYGIFFMLLEVLRDQTDFKYPLSDIDLLADEFGTSEPKVRTVICNYQLFNVDEKEKFFSPKLILYLQPYFDRVEHARIAAKSRWDKGNAGALPEHSGSNANKLNKTKENKINKTYPPEFENWYKDYPNPENKAQTFNNWKKVMKEFTVEQIEAAKNNYKSYLVGIKRGFEYAKNSSNFLGRDAVFRDYLEPKDKQPAIVSHQPDPSRLRYQKLMEEY